MSISLNNHESRIKALENRPSGGTITSQSLNGNGYVKFSNGLMFQWGNGKTFPTSFPNACLRVIATYSQTGGADDNADIVVVSMSKTGYSVYRNGYNTYFFAIGYLISNSIRSLLGGGLKWL